VLAQVNWNLDSYLRNMMRVSDTVYYRVIKSADLEQSDTAQELRDALKLLYAKDRDVLVSLAVFDENGELISATPLTELKNSVTPSREGWFTAAMERIENLHFSTPHVQHLFEDPDARYHWVVSLSRHVELTRGGVIQSGVLLVDMNFSGIEQICKANLPRLTTECLENFGAVKSCIRQESETSLVKALALDTNRLSRLRTLNGGAIMLDWLQREKCSGRIIPDHALRWLEQENIHVSDIDFILDRMSEQKVCNYLQRQKSGTRDSLRQIIFTWRDYLSMADKLGINTHDEIVYRVKLLRQRHDELVEQLRKRERDMEAAATARKYRKIAGICRLIKPKYEYTGEVYSIVVPSGVRDIMREGDALSHCVGKSDRYWERIEQQEAYILFLRKTAEIDKPYYTLEVEPNGTIRQKRTYFDRQNDDLKDAERFLKEWQKVVSERLTESDREKAEKSKVLRLQEFEQLRQDDIRIHTGDLAGQRLVDVLVSDLMETAA